MKPKPFRHLLTTGIIAIGGLSSPVFADGPSDLEALAQKARQAAQDTESKPAPAKKEKEENKPKKEANKPKAKAEKPKAKGKDKAKLKAAENQELPKAKQEKLAESKKKAKKAKKAAKPDPAKRAEALGLLSQVSADAQGVFTLYEGDRLWKEMLESQLGGVLKDYLAENDVNLEDAESPAAQMQSIFSEEFMVVVGDGTDLQTTNLLKLNNWSDKFEASMMMRLWAMGLGGENDDDALDAATNPFGQLEEAFTTDPKFALNLLTSMEMPPILIVARVSDDETRESYGMGLEMGAGMALTFAGEEYTFLSAGNFETGGVSFSGLEIDGAGLIDTFAEDMDLRSSLEEILDPATAQDFINTLKEKDLVIAGGSSDEAVYLYIGSRDADVPLVKEGQPSLTSTEGFAFTDAYLDKDILSVTWLSKDLVAASAKGQPILGSYLEGMTMELEKSKTFGDTTKLLSLISKTESAEKTLLGLNQYSATGSLSYLAEDGLYTENYGGVTEGAYDLETPFTLGTDSENAFLTAQWVESEAGVEAGSGYISSVGEMAYEMATILSKMPELDKEMEEYKKYFQLFDTKMKTDALSLYQGLDKAGSGMGYEGVMEIDLKGTWPTVPKVPSVIVEEGLAPRITLLSPVADGEKLSESWKEIEKSAANLLKTAGEIAGEKIPMQKPMSSQANELMTWFYPIPMQTDDFVPSVTLDNEVMALSTSKKRAIELARLSKQKPEAMSGVYFTMNFKPMQEFLSAWIQLAEDNPEELLENEEMAEFYEENRKELKAVVEALDELDSWSTHMRLEDGKVRSSSHLKTK